MNAVARLDHIVRERHLLKHPFYQAWAHGEVTEATLRQYAGQYYHFESNFPRYVAATYARILDGKDRRLLLDNLVDEEGRPPTHPELWLDFAEGLGMSRGSARGAAPSPSTRALCRSYERFTLRGSAASGLGALYAYESIFPEIAAEKSRGLKEHYGIRGHKAHEFFRVHTTADVGHSEAERRLLGREAARSMAAARQAEAGTRGAIAAWWSFLDAFAVS